MAGDVGGVERFTSEWLADPGHDVPAFDDLLAELDRFPGVEGTPSSVAEACAKEEIQVVEAFSTTSGASGSGASAPTTAVGVPATGAGG